MAPVKKKPVLDDDVEVLAEKVRGVNRKEKKLVFITVEGSTQSERDPIVLKNRVPRPPKNLILVEEPLDTGVPKTRQMRNFPTEDFLSAKIKMANGTDYSNHFIEEHFNPRSRGKRRFKKTPKNIGAIDLTKKKKKKKKVSIEDLVSQVEKNQSKEEAPDEVIDLTTDKPESKFNSMTVCRPLVPYSSSDDESDDDNSVDEEDEESTNISRQYLICEGLDEDKFKFQHKTTTKTYGREKKGK